MGRQGCSYSKLPRNPAVIIRHCWNQTNHTAMHHFNDAKCYAIGMDDYHINLWIAPGSCGHSNPLYRKTYPVTALTVKNHAVSKNSGK